MTHRPRTYALAVGLLTVLAASASPAVDGVIEINQARAANGGVTPGDAPGFPVTISTGTFAADPMSFRLTGPLFTSTTGNMIEVLSPHVTIDLNGFGIICLLSSCSGTGIMSSEINVSVANGSVRGFATGVSLSGNGSVIEHVRATGGAIGLSAGNVCAIRSCEANGNSNDGIRAGNGCLVSGNTATNNGGDGISTGAGSNVLGNTILGNTAFGLNLASGTGYSQNVVNGNGGGSVSLGVPAGNNVCNGTTTCP